MRRAKAPDSLLMALSKCDTEMLGSKQAREYTIQQLARERNRLQTDNRTGFPTFTTDVAQGIGRLIKTDRCGLCQIVSYGSANRHKLTQEILKLNGLNKKVEYISLMQLSH